MVVNDETKIEFGEEKQINDYQFLLPVIVDDEEMSIDDVNFIIEPHNVRGKSLYQPHIKIVPKYQHQGLRYKIFKAFLFEFGNIYCSHWCVVNKPVIFKILDKLGREPGVTRFERTKDYYYISIEND